MRIVTVLPLLPALAVFACGHAGTEDTAGQAAELSGAATTIIAEHSGKCLDVRGGVAAKNDGAAIEQWTCTGQSNQAWTLTDKGNGQYQIAASSSDKCLDVAGGATANGSAIQQATCTNATRQLWRLRATGNGRHEIVSVSSGRCLDITGGPAATGDGALAELWDCTGEANQAWQIGGTPPAPASPPPGDPGPGGPNVGPFGQDASQYTLTFADEFEGSSLDESKWVDHLWYLPPDPTPNYAVNGGSLKIWPVPGTDLNRNYRHITTDEIYYQTYGYFEMEAKLPRGRGPWPAFWLYNHDAPTLRPEIDIMEAYPGGGPNSGWSDAQLRPTAFAATIWLGPEGVNGGHKTLQTPDLSAGFHRYAVKWEPNRQTYYFDGQPYFTANVSMGNRMYILLSYQFGSASGQPDGSTPLGPGNAFEVRYVRAWKMK